VFDGDPAKNARVMETRHRLRPELAPPPATLREIQRQIEALDREDRAMLRPWILARYDVRGYRTTGAVTAPASPAPAAPARR